METPSQVDFCGMNAVPAKSEAVAAIDRLKSRFGGVANRVVVKGPVRIIQSVGRTR
jgi:hypothetical protein